MTTDLPPIELPERVHGPVRPADVPDGWEWKYALYDPHTTVHWHTDPPSPSSYMLWVREPEPVTIEIDANLATRLAHDSADLIYWGKKNRTTTEERQALWEAINKAKANR